MQNNNNTGIWVLAATILGSGMAFLDSSVVNVALAAIQADLNATVSQLQWVVEAYLVFLAALILVGGSLGDRYGRRRIYSLGITLFTIASIWCGLAPTAGQLVLARGVQGIGGALLTPGSLAIITAYFNDDERRGRAIGTWSAATTVIFIMGPVLGGWLVDVASWRWVFFINVPLAVATLAILQARVPESRDEDMPPVLDWWGSVTATLGLGGLSYGLIESSNLGLGHPVVLGAVAAGILFLTLFIVIEWRSGHAMMPLGIFHSRTFSGVNLLTFFLYGALGWFSFYLPLNLIQVQGYSAAQFGIALLPFPVILTLLSPWAGGLAGRVGARLPLVIGPAIVGIGYLLLALPTIGGSYWTTFFPGLAAVGVGMGITVAPLTTTVMGAVSSKKSGIASGVNNAVARSANLLAVAVFGIFALAFFSRSFDSRLLPLNLSPGTFAALDLQKTRLAEVEAPPGLDAGVGEAVDAAVELAFVDSFKQTSYLIGLLAFLSAAIALFTVEGKRRIPEEQVV